MAEGFAAVGLTVIDETGPRAVIHARCWQVPARVIDDFAAYMTSSFGPPGEMISDAETMAAQGERSAAEDGTVYLLGGEVRDG